MKGVRLRQAVLVAAELKPVAEQLRAELGLGEPFRDPGVAAFGVHNVVFALGDAFIEVVSPMRDGTAAGRYLQRRGGDCGYMLIFQLDDLEPARARAKELGIRVVWQADHEDISGTHLHPADMCGAIVSLDRADPPGSWRWGGPDWTGKTGTGAPGRLTGVTLRVKEPDEVAGRWASVLGVETRERAMDIDQGHVVFEPCADERDEGLMEIAVAIPEERRRGREHVEIGGVRFTFASG
jgi:Glyoxalase-like domain